MKAKMVFSSLFLSGIAIACGAMLPLPIPPVPINISATDLMRATLLGYSANAGYAAAMKKLDTLGQSAVGASAWLANSYGGEIIYSVSLAGVTGANTMYVEKGCNKNFVDNVPRSGSGGGGGSIDMGGGCNGSSPDYGIVGYTETSQPWTVCTPDGCSSGAYYEYEVQYGLITGDC